MKTKNAIKKKKHKSTKKQTNKQTHYLTHNQAYIQICTQTKTKMQNNNHKKMFLLNKTAGRGGLMVGLLDCRLRSLGSRTGVASLART